LELCQRDCCAKYTYRGGVLVNDFDSFAARDIFAGSFPCHIFCRRRRVASSSSRDINGSDRRQDGGYLLSNPEVGGSSFQPRERTLNKWMDCLDKVSSRVFPQGSILGHQTSISIIKCVLDALMQPVSQLHASADPPWRY
jgi:hypothetical protein